MIAIKMLIMVTLTIFSVTLLAQDTTKTTGNWQWAMSCKLLIANCQLKKCYDS